MAAGSGGVSREGRCYLTAGFPRGVGMRSGRRKEPDFRGGGARSVGLVPGQRRSYKLVECLAQACSVVALKRLFLFFLVLPELFGDNIHSQLHLASGCFNG